eukprot:scaffold18347_cov128-Isochrysis_galbana.AAC.2
MRQVLEHLKLATERETRERHLHVASSSASLTPAARAPATRDERVNQRTNETKRDDMKYNIATTSLKSISGPARSGCPTACTASALKSSSGDVRVSTIVADRITNTIHYKEVTKPGPMQTIMPGRENPAADLPQVAFAACGMAHAHAGPMPHAG